MRKAIVPVTAAVVLAVAGIAVAAGTVHGQRTPVNCMDSLWRSTRVSTTSTHFRRVPGFTDTPAAVFPIAINVSTVMSGAPVQFRVLSTNVGEQTHPSRPGATRFVPVRGNPDSFAYQWIEPNQSAAVHGNFLRLQWRSPSGHPVHMLRGDMSVQYQTTHGACQGTSS
jgi:hypothetical protein